MKKTEKQKRFSLSIRNYVSYHLPFRDVSYHLPSKNYVSYHLPFAGIFKSKKNIGLLLSLLIVFSMVFLVSDAIAATTTTTTEEETTVPCKSCDAWSFCRPGGEKTRGCRDRCTDVTWTETADCTYIDPRLRQALADIEKAKTESEKTKEQGEYAEGAADYASCSNANCAGRDCTACGGRCEIFYEGRCDCVDCTTTEEPECPLVTTCTDWEPDPCEPGTKQTQACEQVSDGGPDCPDFYNYFTRQRDCPITECTGSNADCGYFPNCVDCTAKPKVDLTCLDDAVVGYGFECKDKQCVQKSSSSFIKSCWEYGCWAGECNEAPLPDCSLDSCTETCPVDCGVGCSCPDGCAESSVGKGQSCGVISCSLSTCTETCPVECSVGCSCPVGCAKSSVDKGGSCGELTFECISYFCIGDNLWCNVEGVPEPSFRKNCAAIGKVCRNAECVEGPEPDCGNGIIETGEQCDGANFGGKTCIYFGFAGGSLSCVNCRFDTSGCTEGEGPTVEAKIIGRGESCAEGTKPLYKGSRCGYDNVITIEFTYENFPRMGDYFPSVTLGDNDLCSVTYEVGSGSSTDEKIRWREGVLGPHLGMAFSEGATKESGKFFLEWTLEEEDIPGLCFGKTVSITEAHLYKDAGHLNDVEE